MTRAEPTVHVLSGREPRGPFQAALAHRYSLRFPRSARALQEGVVGAAGPAVGIVVLRSPRTSLLQRFGKAAFEGLRGCAWIACSAVDDADVVRRCYALGARDYVALPFQTGELRVKVERLFARASGPDTEPRLMVDAEQLALRFGDSVTAPLTAREFQIVSMLARAPDRRAARPELLARIWGGTRVGPRTLDVHLSNLRPKLAAVGWGIRADGPGRVALCPTHRGDAAA